MFDRIVVPFDGPDVLEIVLPVVSRVIGQRDTEIILLPLERTSSEGKADERVPEKYLLEPWRSTLLRRRGSPVEEILGVVQSSEASLVAMATRTSVPGFPLANAATLKRDLPSTRTPSMLLSSLPRAMPARAAGLSGRGRPIVRPFRSWVISMPIPT